MKTLESDLVVFKDSVHYVLAMEPGIFKKNQWKRKLTMAEAYEFVRFLSTHYEDRSQLLNAIRHQATDYDQVWINEEQRYQKFSKDQDKDFLSKEEVDERRERYKAFSQDLLEKAFEVEPLRQISKIFRGWRNSIDCCNLGSKYAESEETTEDGYSRLRIWPDGRWSYSMFKNVGTSLHWEGDSSVPSPYVAKDKYFKYNNRAYIPRMIWWNEYHLWDWVQSAKKTIERKIYLCECTREQGRYSSPADYYYRQEMKRENDLLREF